LCSPARAVLADSITSAFREGTPTRDDRRLLSTQFDEPLARDG
jgi:hypothetical protein